MAVHANSLWVSCCYGIVVGINTLLKGAIEDLHREAVGVQVAGQISVPQQRIDIHGRASNRVILDEVRVAEEQVRHGMRTTLGSVCLEDALCQRTYGRQHQLLCPICIRIVSASAQ